MVRVIGRITWLWLLLAPLNLPAQPAGYYDTAEGKSGEALQQALHEIIDDHTVLSYSGVWGAVYQTDDRPDGTVWDMYSDVPGGDPPYVYQFGSDQCGNYSGEGSCYNREHSFPKSWFDDASPMYTDLFHLYPTDGYVNGRRGNYPFGETDAPDWTSLNGSKVGPSSVTGYNGTVFEPIDTYKGDFARTYFYMATRYYGEDGGWPGSPMTDGAQPEPWALDMLIRWHREDPVSDKERNRNDAVFGYQSNRNPFIDHPDYVDLMYGEPQDIFSPEVDSVQVLAADTLVIWFNEELEEGSALEAGHYSVTGGDVLAAEMEEPNYAVRLVTSSLETGSHNLVITGVRDEAGNVMQFAVFSFSVDVVAVRYRGVSVASLYPNPNRGVFHVRLSDGFSGNVRFRVTDMTGREQNVRISGDAGVYRLCMEGERGCYLLRVMDGERISDRVMFVVQ